MPLPISGLRAALALGLTVAAVPALAQTTTITLDNATPPIVIPLKDATSIEIDGNGDLTAECVLNGTTCQGVTIGGTKAAGALSRTPATGSIEAGQAVTIGWTATNAELCTTSSTPAMPAWSGVVATSGGSKQVTLPAAGDYSFSLICYNSTGGSTGTSTVQVTATPSAGPQTPAGCDITSTDPLFTPAGFTEHRVPWSTAFYGSVYPATGGYLNPIGSVTMGKMPVNGRYLAIEFKPAAGQGLSLAWEQAQAVAQHNYRTANPAGPVFLSISPCPGDFRLPVSSPTPASVEAEDYLRPACRKFDQAGTIYLNTTKPSFNNCGIVPTRTYYLNVLFANPNDGLITSETTCLAGTSCEANFQ